MATKAHGTWGLLCTAGFRTNDDESGNFSWLRRNLTTCTRPGARCREHDAERSACVQGGGGEGQLWLSVCQ